MCGYLCPPTKQIFTFINRAESEKIMDPGTHLSLSCKELAFICTVQNYTFMLSVAPSTAVFKLQCNWAIRIRHWLGLGGERNNLTEGSSHEEREQRQSLHLWKQSTCALGWTTFEDQLLKQEEPLAAPLSLHSSPSISALHQLLLCQPPLWPLPRDLAPAKEKAKAGSIWLYWITQILPKRDISMPLHQQIVRRIVLQMH